jgi:hypothetical protein
MVAMLIKGKYMTTTHINAQGMCDLAFMSPTVNVGSSFDARGDDAINESLVKYPG